MTNKKEILVPVVALLAGVLIGGFLIPSFSTKHNEEPLNATSAHKSHSKGKLPHEANNVEFLRNRIKDLERQLANAQNNRDAPPMPPNEENAITNAPPQRRHGPPSAADMRAHLEELRQKDPERYNAITNGMARHRARRLARAQNQLELLASVDTSRLTKKQKENHEKYQDLIARREELHEMMGPNDANLNEDQRHEIFSEMREVDHQMRELAQSEREMLLNQTATSFGIKGDDANELVETIQAVMQATQSNGRDGGHGAPPPGPPPQN